MTSDPLKDGPTVLNPTQFVEKLDGGNYIVWRDQALLAHILFGHGLLAPLLKSGQP